jgi:hypothetical protein
MSWVTRATAADGFVGSWVSWRESCEEVRAAYRRWSGSSRTERGLAFDGYRAALHREHHAARVYADWAERLGALER